jgi:hypothetical protein
MPWQSYLDPSAMKSRAWAVRRRPAGCLGFDALQARHGQKQNGWPAWLAGEVPGYPDQVRRQERVEARKRRRRFATPAIVTFRMAELFRVFCHRYGGAPLPNDDSGRDDIRLAFQVLSTTGDAARRMVDVARTWAPWLPPDELADLVADVVAHPRRFKADTVAARLGITTEIRDRLKLRTIGATDKPAEQRAAERRERQRLAKEQKRRAAGVLTIAEARKNHAPRQPWKSAGMSRSTWYRRRQHAA